MIFIGKDAKIKILITVTPSSQNYFRVSLCHSASVVQIY